MSENNFKLIAIRPLEDCSSKFIKNLQKGQIYKFYNNYKFFDAADNEVINKGDVVKVEYYAQIPEDLYKITTIGNHEIEVNISAIVGKNGSGKSNLLELFFLGCYVIAERKDKLGIRNNLTKERKKGLEYYWDEEIKYLDDILHTFLFELYFSIDDELYKLKHGKENNLNSEVTNLFFYKEVSGKFVSAARFNLSQLFYTIVINYSLYGLNSNVIGNWIGSLFHKNDGYQTPIVINPFRSEGVVDINSENHLAQSRLLLNLVENQFEDFSYLLDNKVFNEIEFIIEPEQIERLYFSPNRDEFETNIVLKAFDQDYNSGIVGFFSLLMNKLLNYQLPLDLLAMLKRVLKKDLEIPIKDKYLYNPQEKSISYLKLLPLIVKYTVRKVIKICYQYDDYETFRVYLISAGKKAIPSIKNHLGLIKKLSKDNSHITLKLYQVLNAVRESYFYKKWEVITSRNNMNNKAFIFRQSKSDFIKMINNSKNKNYFKKPDELNRLIPNAFFIPNIYITENGNASGAFEFRLLSSGEQQLIHTIQSILYHIKNLNSVFNSSETKKTRYKYINIVLDEIELYFHPEFQRKFIYHLLAELRHLQIPNIKGLNILFSTHSPFILSDIPPCNILKLEEGNQKNGNELTFGANIHDLLKNDFFMAEGFIGGYAQEIISKTLVWLKLKGNEFMKSNFFEIDTKYNFSENENRKEYHKNIIEMIGEPVVKYQLKKMYMEFVDDNEYLDAEIEKIKKMKK